MRVFATLIALVLACSGVSAEWYKGVTHIHSLWSDGDMAPELIADWYKSRGYHFIAFSEHNTLQENDKWAPMGGRAALQPEHLGLFGALAPKFPEFEPRIRVLEGGYVEMRLLTHEELSEMFNESGKFLLIPGEEMTAIGAKVHTNVVNVRDVISGISEGTKSEVLEAQLQAVERQSQKYRVPMIAHLNHMNWSDGVTLEEALGAPSLRFFEIYNGHPWTFPWGRAEDGMPPSDEAWDVMQSTRLNADPEAPLLYGVATDDSHEYHEWGLRRVNPGRGWVMVQANRLDAEALMRSMQDGAFYSTTGVLIDRIEKTRRELRVTIDAEDGVNYRTVYYGTRGGFDPASQPRLDAAGQPLPRASRQYSPEVGAVLLETTDNPAVYRFTGDELYVRARIFTDKLQDNPVSEGDTITAWIQPVKP